ncbi:response regulator [Paenibacillus sp. FSL W8-0426]|uniref:response regulator n=1 Tax=Paenibacillus sp. FSL W8-0426 TaxID=2921714 RepID=UPI0030DC9A98
MLKAMLVDDEKIALDVLEILLNEIGGVQIVRKCQLAADALACAATVQPDIIFLDIEMPGINGLDAGRQLSLLCPDAEIVFVTAYQQYAVQAFDARAIDYLLKPVAKDRLQETLQRYTRLRQRRDESKASAVQESVVQTKQLQLKVLGGLELYNSGGKLITWRTKKTKELFAYLWFQRGKPVYRYHLLDDLWPNIDVERAQALLHTTLYNLRSLLKSEGFVNKVEFGDERYWMHAHWISSDMTRLESLLESESGNVRELLELYRGDLLEMEYYQWADVKREELRSKFIRHLEKLLPNVDEEIRSMLQSKLLELDYI